MLSDGREALVTARIEAESGPLAALPPSVIARPGRAFDPKLGQA
jgi:hypothetical protein